MKTYKEMLRKTAVVGIPLLAITMIYTLVNGGQNCFGSIRITQSLSAMSLLPILRYYVFTAVIFAFYGFSFLFTRKASDVYHSLPVKRSDLYLSVTLATVTWMGATILINALEMLVILWVSGCPFVPAYIPLSVLYYFIASMIVYAAAAIGCALSGTVVTALASTGVVLFLPRFVQFIIARGIIEQVPIVGWLDLGAFLLPTTNAATGIVAMILRPVYNASIISMPHILYSLLPMLAMLGIGYWAFLRRPSEIAQKNGGHRLWTVTTALLISFAVMLPITMNGQRFFSVYGAVLILAALAVFFVYQLIVSMKFKQVLRTLPCFLISLLAALGLSLLIDSAADSMLNTTPDAAQIQSVTFRGYDEKAGDPVYATLMIRDVAFTDTEVKTYVAEALQAAVEKIIKQAEGDSYEYYSYNPFQVIEPVTIKLANGKTVKRTIEFENIDELNALRMQNEAFAKAVTTYPALADLQYLQVDMGFTRVENEAIYQSYIAEAQANGVTSGYYYRNRAQDMRPDGSYVVQGKNQALMGFTAAGYVDSQRFAEYDTLRLETPETARLVMRTYNAYMTDDPAARIREAIDRFVSETSAPNDSLNVNVNVYNYVDENGLTVQYSQGFYLSRYVMESSTAYDQLQREYLLQFVDMLSRASQTDDPTGLFIQLNWNYYDPTTPYGNGYDHYPVVYLRFENPVDELAFLTLMEDWETAQRTAAY